tara:strand:- start:666 stop:1322 length:657 start_codon:yes stop_codon:yes gene_type:complete
MTKRLVIGLTILVLFTTYNPKSFFLNKIFNIKEIVIENNSILKKNKIKKDLAFIYESNLFFLNLKAIKKILIKQKFIRSFKIKKIYPNKLKIEIFERKPIVIIQDKKDKFFFTEDTNLIRYQNLKGYENLPIVFGNKKNFEILYKDLKKINFSINQIKKYYYFKANRWDLITYKNQTIKLPTKGHILSLENFLILKDKKNFDKYKIFDYRINNQLILK